MKKRKMKGGNLQQTNNETTEKSAYKRMDNKLYLNFIFSIAYMGLIWFFISAFFFKHKNSEVLCYSLMLTSIILSFFLMISIGVVRMQGNSILKKFFNIVMFVITKCLPGIVVGIQIVIMIVLMSTHATYLHETPDEDKPSMLGTFNGAAALGIVFQMYMFRNHLTRVIYPDPKSPVSPATLPGFILIGIITCFCISQMYIILNMLKVDG